MMGEIKSVKVDNWGVFFLQKLQNFFNKTDYCDLTLQFRDNSQLKVHRLVLSACTDYFNVLERATDSTDDILLMPRDLQADVVVPIVNFMYTGTLEFEYTMYDRLFRTAREMNMTVLVKLLEAHRKKTAPPKSAPAVLNKNFGPRQTITRIPISQPAANPQHVSRPIVGVERTYMSPGQKKVPRKTATAMTKYLQTTSVSQFLPKTDIPETIAIVSKYRPGDNSKGGPSRFDPPVEEMIPDTFDTFNTISYESKPLMKHEDKDDTEYDDVDDYELVQPSSSTFEQLRKGYTNTNKRMASTSAASPPTKRLNLQDVKEYTEAARQRKQIEAEDPEEEPTYVYEDDTHFNDDEEDDSVVISKSTIKNNQEQKSTKTLRTTASEEDSSRILVKDNSGSVHHAQIISEVLKKYPHLVKNNKNIKLKIMQKSTSQVTSNTISISEAIKQEKSSPPKQIMTQIKTEKPEITISTVRPSVVDRKVTTQQPLAQQTAGPKKIDSKTMHALIAKGAENMTGPWLCLKCGIGGRPISIPSYKAFRRHLINIHKEKIDPRICEHCGWKSIKKNELIQHYFNAHNIKIKVETAATKTVTQVHKTQLQQKSIKDYGNKKEIQHCIYCNKVFSKESLLYAHMKSTHKEKAREDGVMDFSDDEHNFDDSDKYIPNDPNATSEKIKILSNISLPSKNAIPFVLDPSAQTVSQIGGKSNPAQQMVNLEPSSEAEALSNVASGIATSLGLVDNSVVIEESHYHTDPNTMMPSQYIEDSLANEINDQFKKDNAENSLITKLVTTDGTELQLTPSQKQEILSQLQGQTSDLSDNVVMVLNQENFEGGEIITSESQNIMVVYSQADTSSMKQSNIINSVVTDVQIPTDETENSTEIAWQENLNEKIETENVEELIKDKDDTIASNERSVDDSDITNTTKDKREDIDKLKLISALEGDWTDDEEDLNVSASSEAVVAHEEISEETTKTGITNMDIKLKDTVEVDEKSEKAEELFFITTDQLDENKEEQITKKSESEEKELSTIIGEWYDKENSNDDSNKKSTEEKTEKSEEQTESMKSENNDESQEAVKSSEIKGLINDWEDEDDEEI